MLNYTKYINDILNSNAKANYKSSLLTYERSINEIDVYTILEAYYSLLNDVQESINDFFQDLKMGVETRLLPLFNNMKIINVIYEEDNSYVFELNGEQPFAYNVKLRLRKLKDDEEISNKNTNARGETVLRENDNNFSDYELSIVNNSINSLGFTVAAIFYENARKDLFDLLGDLARSYYAHLIYEPKLDIPLPLSIELHDGGVSIYYTGYNDKSLIFRIHREKEIVFGSTFYNDEFASLSANPIWFLNNIYITKDDYINNNLYDYFDDGNYNLCSIFMKAGYGETEGFIDMCCDLDSWVKNENKYYIRYENNKFIEIKNYIDFERNDKGDFIFEFIDGSFLTIPENEIISVKPNKNDNNSIALLTLKGRL